MLDELLPVENLMYRNRSLQTKLLLLACGSALSVAVLVGVVLVLTRRASGEAASQCLAISSQQLDDNVRSVVSSCSVMQEAQQMAIDTALQVGDKLLRDSGGLQQSQTEAVKWTAVNQFSKQPREVTLPKVSVGGAVLGKNDDPAVPSPLVDEIQRITGATCTLFQRMNREGDMLRVCTNVRTAADRRAIGTFIPCIQPDGQANPVSKAILAGETYRGRAYVVTAWYVTAYQPLFDRKGEVVGILYVGIPVQNIPALRRIVTEMRFGESGRAFVYESTGNPVYSGFRTGGAEPTFVRTVCEKARKLKGREIAEQRFALRPAPGDPERGCRARFSYYAPFDWVIGVSIEEEEVLRGEQAILQSCRQAQLVLVLAGALLAASTLAASAWLGRSIVRRARAMVSHLEDLGSGRLTNEADAGPRDELGQMAVAFNDTLHKLKTALGLSSVDWDGVGRQRQEVARLAAMVESAPTNVLFADADFNLRYINPAALRRLADLRDYLPCKPEALLGRRADAFHPGLARCASVASGSTLAERVRLGPETIDLVVCGINDANGRRMGSMISWEVVTQKLALEKQLEDSSRQLGERVARILAAVQAVARKDYSSELDITGTDAIGQLANGLRQFFAEKQRDEARIEAAAEQHRTQSEDLRRKIDQILVSVNGLADGDFTQSIPDLGEDAVGQMGQALNHAIDSIGQTLRSVCEVANELANASGQLASVSQEMAAGAQEQASSLEETSSTLEEITITVRQNAENAQQARQLAAGSRDVADKGGQVVTSAVGAMGAINQSSRKIADIITTIDEIAFQTNLLALNAAVEAARAGEQGRGFAVVASEVRNLAQRSAVAAKEIKDLIQDSVQKVGNGTELVNRSGQSLDEIVTSVKQVTDIVGEIAAASREQSMGIDQVARAVQQMDAVTQRNASQTEEMSATAETLSGQAEQLRRLVAGFQLGGSSGQAESNAPIRRADRSNRNGGERNRTGSNSGKGFGRNRTTDANNGARPTGTALAHREDITW